jgi:hypothetical protein
MSYKRAPRSALLALAGLAVSPLLCVGTTLLAARSVAEEAGVQVLTRGPVHEAFAAASMSGSKAGIVVTRAPYEPITEMPPDQRPDGDDVAWIPGYWSWDDDRNDYIWVSGVWRDLPPGRQWVPGYWATVNGGSQWISGFWGDVVEAEVTYLPPPPEPLDVGPSSPQPGPGTSWAPGCWIWQQTRYDWQPGYWVSPQPQWVWSPAHYTWTPRGHIYVPGYWDHDLGHRGVIFAPVYYDRPVYTQPNYYYSPSVIIDLAVMATLMFVQPRSHHYYFGDYYDRRYEDRGYYPWHSRQASRFGYDPLFLQYRAEQLRHDRDWDIHVEDLYRHRQDHAEYRPPQTLALQINLINQGRSDGRERLEIGRNLADAIVNRTQPQRFAPVGADERDRIANRGREVRKLQTERATLESVPAAIERSGGDGPTAAPTRVRMPRSPVAARTEDGGGRIKTPPPSPAIPAAKPAERLPAGNSRPDVTSPTRQIPGQLDQPETRGQRRDSVGNTPGPVIAPRQNRSAPPERTTAPKPRVEQPRENARSPKSDSTSESRETKVRPDITTPTRQTPVQLDQPETRGQRGDSNEKKPGPVIAPRQNRSAPPQSTVAPNPRVEQPRENARSPKSESTTVAPRQSQVRPPAARVESMPKREPFKAKRPKSSEKREQVKPKRSPVAPRANTSTNTER